MFIMQLAMSLCVNIAIVSTVSYEVAGYTTTNCVIQFRLLTKAVNIFFWEWHGMA